MSRHSRLQGLLTSLKSGELESVQDRTVDDYLILFNRHLQSANTQRVISFQQIYNTFARAQLEGLEPGPVRHDEDVVIREYWDIIDSSYSEGSSVNFVYEIFNSKLEEFYEAGGDTELGQYRRETIARYRAAGPEPAFVQQLQTIVFADDNDILRLEQELNRPNLGNATTEELILLVLANTGTAGAALVNSYLQPELEITTELATALFNPKLIELGQEKNEQLRE